MIVGGDQVSVPVVVLPFVGRSVDPALFQVGRADRVGVSIGYIGSRPSVPGVVWSGQHTGYVTRASQRVFVAALAARYAKSRRAPHDSGSRFPQLPGGIKSIAVAGSGWAGPPVRPRYAMHTLVVAGTDADSDAAGGADDVIVVNVDDSRRYPATAEPFYAGESRFSVPTGHYAAYALFPTLNGAGDVTDLRIVTRSEFSVTTSRTLTMRATEATTQVHVATPRPTVAADTTFSYRRDSVRGDPFEISSEGGAGVPVRVAPSDAVVRMGRLRTAVFQRLESPQQDYTYVFSKAADSVIPVPRYVAGADSFAALHTRLFSDVPSSRLPGLASYSVAAAYDWQNFGGTGPRDFIYTATPGLRIPQQRIVYLSAEPSLVWETGVSKWTVPDAFSPFGTASFGGQYASERTFHAGAVVRDDWNAQPLHPIAEQDPQHQRPNLQPAVTRAGDSLNVNLHPFGDSTPGHAGGSFDERGPDTSTGTYAVYSDNTRVAAGDADRKSAIGAHVDVPEGAAPLRLVVDTARRGPHYQLSTRTHTEWTWASATRPATARLSYPNWICDAYAYPTSSACTVEPVMTVGYQVAGLGLSDRATPNSAASIGITIGHLTGTPAYAVLDVSARYSTDDGTTWKPATIIGSGRQVTASFRNPVNGFVSLHVEAADTHGGHITETITRAYAIGTHS